MSDKNRNYAINAQEELKEELSNENKAREQDSKDAEPSPKQPIEDFNQQLQEIKRYHTEQALNDASHAYVNTVLVNEAWLFVENFLQ